MSKKTDIIARKIVEHCFIYFMSSNCPQILLSDDNDKIVLNDLYRDILEKHKDMVTFNLKEKEFGITFLKIYANVEDKEHTIHYCANNREVLNGKISRLIPEMPNEKIKDEMDGEFLLRAYISGNYLDEIVNTERTDFHFIKEDEETTIFKNTSDEISRKELDSKIAESMKEYLNHYLEQMSLDKIAYIEDYIKREAPQYRVLLSKKYLFADIHSKLPKDKLDIALYEIMQKLDIEIKRGVNEILGQKISDVKDLVEYKDKYNKYIDDVNDIGKAKLVEYIVHRKLVLDLLERALEWNTEGKYSLEEYIHKIVFPLKNSSDTVDYEKHNLWIIDEKLSYHYYLASDLPLNKVQPIDSDSLSRPDILIFNNPIAVVDSDSSYSSIVLLEFKRPQREEFTKDDDPIKQLYTYIININAGKAKNSKGRTIPKDQIYYCYLICDITEPIKNSADQANLAETPDGSGYYGFNPTYKAYVEVISYDKLLKDAKKRNRVLFKKLSILT
ncbi:MAG: hypothetical protein HQK96_15690 [Nitrospirae bacterium]|nr:hypothetical protein [Nitrospirota bacterium]